MLVGDVCIHQAIKFHIDVEGFWYPEVDKDKCTDCGLCEKACPIINKEDWHESWSDLKSLIVMSP